MNARSIVAVISGDLVKSRRHENDRSAVLDGVASSIKVTRSFLAAKHSKFLYSGFYRGDSFQCALSEPKHALWTALFLRAELKKLRRRDIRVDVRIGLGLGAFSIWNERDISASDGEAFQLSGKALDSLKSAKEKYRRLRIHTPWPDADVVFSILASFLDAVSQRWTLEQSEAISLSLINKTQEEISRALKVQQPAVQMRLQTASYYAVKEALDYFGRTVDDRIIEKGPYNRPL
jgi:hypothetical protein